MPWSSIDLTTGAGFWTFLGSVITVICLTFVRLLMLLLLGKTNRDSSLSERENKLFTHLSDEISRLNAVVADFDAALKSQAEMHRADMLREREECNARMTALQAEIELLKRRMSSEESR